jgi:hypothetical protein
VTLPDVDTVADRAKLPRNDPKAATALLVACSWARTVLGRPVDDPLDDLNDAGNEAVAGAAADFAKLPAAQAALLQPDNVDLAVLPFDIGRRWETLLGRGNKHLWALR